MIFKFVILPILIFCFGYYVQYRSEIYFRPLVQICEKNSSDKPFSLMELRKDILEHRIWYNTVRIEGRADSLELRTRDTKEIESYDKNGAKGTVVLRMDTFPFYKKYCFISFENGRSKGSRSGEAKKYEE